MIKLRYIGLLVTGMLLAGDGFAKNYALVIGNNNYETISTLYNPVNDATLLSKALSASGFSVMKITNISKKTFKKHIDRFLNMVSLDYKADIVLFYYAGHGTQVSGENYLVPVDANVYSNQSLMRESLNLNYVLSKLNGIHSQTNVIILDACRNMPFNDKAKDVVALERNITLPIHSSARERGLKRLKQREQELSVGFTELKAPQNTLISFSTAPGMVAEDGNGRNSTFTRALATEIVKSNVALETIFMKITKAVSEATNERQQPWVSHNLTASVKINKGQENLGSGGW